MLNTIAGWDKLLEDNKGGKYSCQSCQTCGEPRWYLTVNVSPKEFRGSRNWWWKLHSPGYLVKCIRWRESEVHVCCTAIYSPQYKLNTSFTILRQLQYHHMWLDYAVLQANSNCICYWWFLFNILIVVYFLQNAWCFTEDRSLLQRTYNLRFDNGKKQREGRRWKQGQKAIGSVWSPNQVSSRGPKSCWKRHVVRWDLWERKCVHMSGEAVPCVGGWKRKGTPLKRTDWSSSDGRG